MESTIQKSSRSWEVFSIKQSKGYRELCELLLRIPTKPAMHSNSKPAGYSDLKPATRGVVRMGQIHDVVEGWEGQETGWS
jgi:hypothetical protein